MRLSPGALLSTVHTGVCSVVAGGTAWKRRTVCAAERSVALGGASERGAVGGKARLLSVELGQGPPDL